MPNSLPPLLQPGGSCRFGVLIAALFGLGMVRGPVARVAEPLSAIPRPDRGLTGPRGGGGRKSWRVGASRSALGRA